MSIGGLALFKRMFSVSFLVYSCFIQLIMSFNTSGLVVSSIVTYSEGWPVVACWNRWLRPGYSLISVFLWRRSSIVRLREVCLAAALRAYPPFPGSSRQRPLPFFYVVAFSPNSDRHSSG